LRPTAADTDLEDLRTRVTSLAARFPLYPELTEAAQ